jgi:hypothetical protein
MEWERGLRPQVGTAIRAEVQFFAPVGKQVERRWFVLLRVLYSREAKIVGKSFMMKHQVRFFFFFQTQLFSRTAELDLEKKALELHKE